MSSINSVVLTGRLTRDPELRTTPGGTTVGEFSIAVNSREKINDEWADRADFFEITCFGQTAENVAQYLSKGRMVGVSGRLRHERWEKDGEKRSKVKVVARDVQFLDSKDRDDDGGGEPYYEDKPVVAPMDAPPI